MAKISVNWYKNKFDVISYISNIYGNEYKKEVIVYRLPLWRDLTMVQKLAYFFYFMVETKDFENITAFERPKDGGTWSGDWKNQKCVPGYPAGH